MRVRLAHLPIVAAGVLASCGSDPSPQEHAKLTQDATLPPDGSAPDGSTPPGKPTLLVEQDFVSLQVSVKNGEGIYVETCTNELRVKKREGGEWVSLRDDRPTKTNGPYILDGVSHAAVFEDEGCDTLVCVPFEERAVRRDELVPNPLAPDSDVPVLSTRLAAFPLRVELDYFTNQNCKGKPITIAAEIADANAPVVPLPTVIRVKNGAAATRSRQKPCSSDYAIRVLHAARASGYTPTCSPVQCDSLPKGKSVPEDSSCSAPSCADTRVDLPPGQEDIPYTWSGRYAEANSRNCWEDIPLERGDPMVAVICTGSPGADEWSIAGLACKKYPFEYGQETLEVVLD